MAIVGAPMDELVFDRPGTRFAPRAIRAASCPPGPQLESKVEAFAEVRVVEFGDAPVLPADPVLSHAAITALAADRIVREILGGIVMNRRETVASQTDRKEKEEE